MKCLICKEKIVIRVTWDNLFREKKVFICDKCFYKYPVKMNYQVLPINEGLLHVFSLFDKKYNLNPEAFVLELSRLFSFLMEKYDFNEDGLFYYDDIDGLLNNLFEIEKISKLVKNKVIITTFS